MIGRFSPRRPKDASGFSLAELLIFLVVALVVITGVYQLLIGQNRLYIKQRELQDVRATLRASANLLAFEFRQASPALGDLYFITPDSFAVRSLRGSGTICGLLSSQPRFGLWRTSGEFNATTADSAMIFAAGIDDPSDDKWKIVRIQKIWDPVGGGIPFCEWSNSPPTDIVVTVRGDADSVQVGAPFRAFRRAQYGSFLQDGRWWLGRRSGSAGGYELLAGPLRPPSDSGLVFIYYDASGVQTADPAEVRFVDIVLRGESLRRVPQPGAAPAVQGDTLTIRVSLRG